MQHAWFYRSTPSVATIEKEEGIFIRTQVTPVPGITNNSSTNNGATNNGSIPLDVPKGTGGDIKLLMSPAFRVSEASVEFALFHCRWRI
jgi:hypothetical protein